ncbi:MAG TPA: glycosyltransferase family 2 protein [Rhabdochlamydiaceae bacterium]
MKYLFCFLLVAFGLVLGSKMDVAFSTLKRIPFFKAKKLLVAVHPVVEHKPFVFVIPSYNNAQWVEKNLRSIFEQKYDNFRVIYIDDASTDNTLSKVRALVAEYKQEHRVQICFNQTNCGAAENIYRAGHACADREIMIVLDGDDWVAHDQVLQKLNEKYADPAVWATYGSYIEYPSYSYTVKNYAQPIPSEMIAKNAIRSFSKGSWNLSHMRTFYAGLFKQIRLQDLIVEGSFYDAASDVAFMVPIAEMAGEHLLFIKDILYIYNRATPLNDHKVRAERQRVITEHILDRRPYLRIASAFPESLDSKVDIIAFSFNRPMQLYALLESRERYAKNVHKTIVLYRASADEYEEGYAQVRAAFPDVRFVRQSNEAPARDFKPLLLGILNSCEGDFLSFAVDDLLLTDEIDFAYGAKMLQKTGAHCFCYRLGKDVDYCYMMNQAQKIPPLTCVEGDVLAWSFEEGSGDWNYLNSVDLALYRKKEVVKAWNSYAFTDPNTLETQWYLKGKKKGLGLCHTQTKMVNIPLNEVNTSLANRHLNSYTPKELLEKFQAGFKIDINPLYRMRNRSAHIECDVQFVKRVDHEQKM